MGIWNLSLMEKISKLVLMKVLESMLYEVVNALCLYSYMNNILLPTKDFPFAFTLNYRV